MGYNIGHRSVIREASKLMLQLQPYTEAAAFLRVARAFLEQQEVVNDLMLGLAIRLVEEPLAYGSPPYFAVVTDKGSPLLAALMTPPHNLILASAEVNPVEALDRVARHLVAEGWPVPGVISPVSLADGFADRWERLTGAARRVVMDQRVFELRRVNHPCYSPGFLRPATGDDLDLVCNWMVSFQREALPPGNPPPSPERLARSIAAGHVFLWEDGVPVSMAQQLRPTPHGVSIGAVYTPPEFRRRGYATSCVASLSQRLLDAGFSYCTLFTDLSNPTSNHIYQQIGYRPVCDFRQIAFSGLV